MLHAEVHVLARLCKNYTFPFRWTNLASQTFAQKWEGLVTHVYRICDSTEVRIQ